ICRNRTRVGRRCCPWPLATYSHSSWRLTLRGLGVGEVLLRIGERIGTGLPRRAEQPSRRPADFSSIPPTSPTNSAELAACLNWLNEHDEAYQELLTWKYTGLNPSFQRLVEGVRGGHPQCRLCEYLGRTDPAGPSVAQPG